ncbi:hypothetical protein KJ763_00675, partial [Patescibacteria group bacterium]|nr:hypothetical protein [Patescibacteria group bacterium]
LRLPAKTNKLLPIQGQDINITGNYKDQVVNDPGWSVALGLCVWNMRDNEKSSSSIKNMGKFKPNLKRWFKIFLP